MQVPLQVSFQNLEHSASIVAAIQKRAEKLEKFYPRIISMKVLIKPLDFRHRQGTCYGVRVSLTVPGKEIVAGHSPELRQSHEDVYVAIRDSFKAARRQLEDYVRIHFKPRKHQHQIEKHLESETIIRK